MSTSRRSFFAASAAACLAPAAARSAAGAVIARIDGGLPASFPAHDPADVELVVGKSHTDYDTVREVVTARPGLAKVAWDWGFGDWESALGAASHMGRRDIAELLIGHGARPNLFTFAMLGQVDVVRAICESNPGVQGIHGPHGITLLRHARAGRDAAADVVEYLTRLGGADEPQRDLPLDPAVAAAYVGTFEPEGGSGIVFSTTFHERRQRLTFQRDDRQFRFLLHAGDHTFHPGGGADIRLVFDVVDDRARAVTIHDGDRVVRARRRG